MQLGGEYCYSWQGGWKLGCDSGYAGQSYRFKSHTSGSCKNIRVTIKSRIMIISQLLKRSGHIIIKRWCSFVVSLPVYYGAEGENVQVDNVSDACHIIYFTYFLLHYVSYFPLRVVFRIIVLTYILCKLFFQAIPLFFPVYIHSYYIAYACSDSAVMYSQ